jgi:hypothetical protein
VDGGWRGLHGDIGHRTLQPPAQTSHHSHHKDQQPDAGRVGHALSIFCHDETLRTKAWEYVLSLKRIHRTPEPTSWFPHETAWMLGPANSVNNAAGFSQLDEIIIQ